MNKIEKKKRNSAIELLRIISMIMIIMSHYSVHGGFNLNNMDFGFNKILLYSATLGNLGVDIFFLISGYFLSKSEFNIKKLLKLLFEVFSYSIIIYIVFCILDFKNFNLILLIKNFFPILFEQYWFATAYVIIYLLFPYLNKFINSLTKKEHIMIISLITVVWSILFTFIGTSFFYSVLIDIILLYFIAAFIQKYNEEIKEKYKKLMSIITILSVVGLLIITIGLSVLNIGSNYILHFYNRNSIFIILIAVGLFVIFLNKKIDSKTINFVSSCMFGIYLLHDNNFVRDNLWQVLLKNYTYQNSNYLIIHFIVSVVLVFIVCTIVEMIRKNTIQKIGDKLIDNFFDKLKNYFTKLINCIKKNGSKIIDIVN